ncbi:glycosyltransferase family 4 protein [Orenia marismortui]|uniref:glycosyltransferase family 4 protein n=1 Tax=Orenia marismortui TaxID=46469 RepID=UPI0003728568|nr:glycosyltransferase family 4 protein [Orenia marismortui]
MNVVHLSTSDINGGAAIAAHRLNLALREEGIDSKMLVMKKLSDEVNVDTAKKGKLEKLILSKLRRLKEKITLNKYKDRENPSLFSTGRYGIDISEHPYIKEADVIHLHWINGGYLSLKSLEKLGRLNKKIVWTMHDMWSFTGGCHYSSHCKKYQKECGDCPILETNKENDITRKVWRKKSKVFKGLDMKIIACSNWIGECARNSSLFEDREIVVISNVLDDNIFKSIDQDMAKEILNLKQNKKYICFGAMNSTSDPRKGWVYLKRTIELLNEENPVMKDDVELLVFGASHSDEIEELPFKTSFMGRIYDEYTLALIYNASDLFVAPSLEDNLPNTVNESLSCGTSVIAFDIGGMVDMIEDKRNGYLAEYKNIEDLARGIKWCLDNLKNVNLKSDKFKKKSIIKEILSMYRS